LDEQTAAAAAYEDLHVPALFEEWCERVLDAASTTFSHRVLDVACGTGVLARTALQRVGLDGAVTGLDLNSGMLAIAGQLEPAVDWQEGTASELPFPDASFDSVVSQFGLMFFPDRELAIREMLRVLSPGGAFAVAVWDGLERQPSYSIEVEILQRLGGDAAADALRAPFCLGDPHELRALFEGAGVDSPRVTTITGEGRFPSIRAMIEADLRGWLPVMGVMLSEPTIQAILDEAEELLAHFVEPNGDVVFDSPAHIVSGRKL
jgi:SAM-dependent methyltransferase